MPDTPQALAIRLREEGARVIDFSDKSTPVTVAPRLAQASVSNPK